VIQNLTGNWTHEHCTHSHANINDAVEMVEAYRPGLVVNLRESHQLNEYTYKDIAQLIDGGFLSQKIRSDDLKRVEYDYIDNDGTIHFLVPSSEHQSNGIKYRNMVQFMEWDQIGQDGELRDYTERARMLLWQGSIKLYCTCPSFLYWGYQWLLTVLDASIYPEDREPRVRNPQHRGICCKHLNRVLRVLPFYSGRIAGAMKEQFG